MLIYLKIDRLMERKLYCAADVSVYRAVLGGWVVLLWEQVRLVRLGRHRRGQ